MIQRSELLTFGITEDQITSYETDLCINLLPIFYNKNRFQYYSFTPNGADGYALVELPKTTILIRNGIATEVEDDTTSISISDTITPVAIDPRDTEDFLFTWFGNNILIDNGSKAEDTTLVCQVVDTSIEYLDTDIKRNLYSLIKALYMQDKALIFSILQKLSVSSKNRLKENVEFKPIGIKRDILNMKAYIL